MGRHTVIWVSLVCMMSILMCILWGERDAERTLRQRAEQRLVETQEKLGLSEQARKDAEDTLTTEKRQWKNALDKALQERDALLAEAFSATPTDLQ